MRLVRLHHFCKLDCAGTDLCFDINLLFDSIPDKIQPAEGDNGKAVRVMWQVEDLVSQLYRKDKPALVHLLDRFLYLPVRR